MDINSLLSPQDPSTSKTETPSQTSSANPSPPRQILRPSVPHRTSTGRSHPESPLVKEYPRSPLAPATSSYNAHNEIQHGPGSAAHQIVTSHSGSQTTSTVADQRPATISRHTSTPQMDALAELAVMQQPNNSHLHASRPPANPLRESHVMQPRRAQSSPSLPQIPFPSPTNDIDMADAPPEQYAVPSFMDEKGQKLMQLSEKLKKETTDLHSHMEFVKLLHDGFQQHIESGREPSTFNFLSELRRAREAMDHVVPVGEALWLDWLHDERILATDMKSQALLLDLYRRAVTEEPASTALWRRYGDHMYFLWSMAFEVEPHPGEGWSQDDKAAGRQAFNRRELLRIWEQAVNATQHNIHDGNVIWDRYIEILLTDPEPPSMNTRRDDIYSKFEDRLLNQPHRTWENTFGMFSKFVTSFASNKEYPKIMDSIMRKTKHVKQNYEHRAPHEAQIEIARSRGDDEAERKAYTDYLAWELGNKGVFSFPYINSLYERAVTRFWNNASLWTAYVEYLILNSSDGPHLANVLERATRHCPWSGDLWSHRLLSMEKAGRSFSEIEALKHQATATGLLELGGVDDLIKLHSTWCGYLRRKAFEPDATEEQLDIAHIGIVSALEHVQTFGTKTLGDEWRGDPQYRLERIQIKFLTHRGDFEQAREVWRRLVSVQHDNHDFWYRFYIWEMVSWSTSMFKSKSDLEFQLQPPTEATAVIHEGLKYHATMDNPESLLAMYRNHCEQHESAEVLQRAIIEGRELQDLISRRRYSEYEAAQQQYNQLAPQRDENQGVQGGELEIEGPTPMLKRKREESESVTKPQPAKKPKDEPKRDREHASVLVKGLPPDTTETRIRQLFTAAGKVNSIKSIVASGGLAAIVEFDSKDGADYAKMQIRDFKGNKIEIQDHERSTIWCTNYPPAADEGYIRNIFKDCGEIVEVRFPSITSNTRRRFCYVDFLHPDDAARAESELNGKVIEGQLKLRALISDPGRREERLSAADEHREVFVKGIDFAATEDDIREFFERCGKIEYIKMSQHESGRTKGFAHVQFTDPEAAKAAVDQLDGQRFPFRRLQVRYSTKRRPPIASHTKLGSSSEQTFPRTPTAGSDSSHNIDIDIRTKKMSTIALANIPSTVNVARVEKMAEQFGEVAKTTLLANHGTAIIVFTSPEGAAQMELQPDKLKIDGQQLAMIPVDQVKNYQAEFKPSKLGEKPRSEKAKASLAQYATSGNDLDPSKITKPKMKRLGLGAISQSRDKAGQSKLEENGAEPRQKPQRKTNDEFRKLFLASGGRPEQKLQLVQKADDGEDIRMEDNLVEDEFRYEAKGRNPSAPEDVPLDDLLAEDDDE